MFENWKIYQKSPCKSLCSNYFLIFLGQFRTLLKWFQFNVDCHRKKWNFSCMEIRNFFRNHPIEPCTPKFLPASWDTFGTSWGGKIFFDQWPSCFHGVAILWSADQLSRFTVDNQGIGRSIKDQGWGYSLTGECQGIDIWKFNIYVQETIQKYNVKIWCFSMLLLFWPQIIPFIAYTSSTIVV